MIRPRSHYRVLIALAAAALAAGTTLAQNGDPVQGGHMSVAFLSTIQDTGDLHRASSSHSAALVGNVLDTLIRKDPADGSYHAGLAESWTIADDNRSITLNLVPWVTFHDGTPFDAEAVRYNLDRIMTLPEARGRTAFAWIGAFYDRTEVVDDLTAVVHFNAPYARMVDVLSTNFVGGIHSPTAIEEHGDDYGTETVVGTGPFMWVEWTGPLGEFTIERNPDYAWGSPIYSNQGAPYLDRVTFRGIVEPGTRSSALESRGVQVAYLQERDIPRFEAMPGFDPLILEKQGTSRYITFNLESPLVSDIRVRQAISHAIDREGLLSAPKYANIGQIAMAFLAGPLWGDLSEFEPHNFMYDPERAIELLDEVGWRDEDGDGIREAHGVEGVPDGTPLRLTQPVNANIAEDSEILSGMLSAVGIHTDMQVQDFASKIGNARQGNFDIIFWSTSGSHFFIIEPILHSREMDGGNNVANYSNPEVDAWLEEANMSIDPERQRELFSLIQKAALDDVVGVPVVDQFFPWVKLSTVHGITTDSSSVGVYLLDAWMEAN
jgi:peptide/nickel transport system substrate-binding protein